LCAVRRQPVARDVRAAAMPTCNFNCDHREEDTISPLIEPLPEYVSQCVPRLKTNLRRNHGSREQNL